MRAELHPPALHLPLFTYNEDLSGAPAPRLPDPVQEPSSSSTIATSTPFAFSAFFQPSEEGNSRSPTALPALRNTSSNSILREESESFFIGFSWGPMADAFPDAPPLTTPPAPRDPVPQTPLEVASFELKTPMRRIGTNTGTGARPSTLRRTGTRTAPRRTVSDREAMRQLVDCIGLSARKKVLESGRTPRLARTTTTTKSLRFASLDFTTANGDSGTLSSALALALAASDDERQQESDGASACTSDSDAPPSPSPSPGPRPGSSMSRRSATPVSTQLLYPPQAPMRPSLPPGDDEDALDVLEERYRALMGEIASIEGKVGAMRRRTR